MLTTVRRLSAGRRVSPVANEPLVAQENDSAFIAESCDGCWTYQQVREMAVRVVKSLGKYCCGLTADWGGPRFNNATERFRRAGRVTVPDAAPLLQVVMAVVIHRPVLMCQGPW